VLTPMQWNSEGTLDLIDQRILPWEEKWIRCRSAGEAARAISDMVVRGAPAIGITAGYGMALAAQDLIRVELNEGAEESVRGGVSARAQGYMEHMFSAYEELVESRPTAVNLEWAAKIQLETASEIASREGSAAAIFEALLQNAEKMHEKDIQSNREIGRHGAGLLREGDRVLTHCNAGALATGGYGTALGVIRFAHDAQMNVQALATETRPFLQGARLTSWELARDGIPVRLIVDSAAAYMMSRGEIDAVVVGADRVAANGDVANKIGTYAIALAAQDNSIPFYVAIPTSTLDRESPSAEGIQIERRPGTEVTHFGSTRVVPDMVEAENYAFDITPARLVTAIITEHGVVEPPFEDNFDRITGQRDAEG